MEDPTEHRHPGSACSIALPADWEVHVDPRPDLALVGIHSLPDVWGFRTNVVLTLDPLDRGMTLLAWQEGADRLLQSVLNDCLMLDREHVYVGERAGVRRLVHHAVDGRAVTLEQWATIDGSRGYTLSASVSTLAYARLGPELGEIAATFRVGCVDDQTEGPT